MTPPADAPAIPQPNPARHPITTVPRGPFVLFGLMTVASVGGPFLMGGVLRGGARPTWPPDRLVEWVTVLGVSGSVLVLMLACLSLGWFNLRKLRAAEAARRGTADSPATDPRHEVAP